MEARDAGADVLELTLDDAIRLALRNNRSLQRARLARETDKLSLGVAEDRYRPRATIGATANTRNSRAATAALSVGPVLRVPTGGEVSLRWSQPLAGAEDADGTWTLRFSQPLLKGFGSGVDTAPLRTARIREKMKVLAFRDSVADTVTSVIRAYRRVIREQHALAISRESLARAKEQLRVNRSLIQAGRMAEREIIQSEAEIANRELALVETGNNLISAESALVSILDVDDGTRVVALDQSLTVERRQPDPERSIETALGSRRDYLSAQMENEIAEIDLRVAENDRLWDLDLTASVSRDDEDGRDYAAGLGLSIPLGDDRSKRLKRVDASNRVRDTEIALVERRQSIRIDVRQAVHDVEVGFRSIELARRARELVERQLEVEQAKLAQGLTSAYRLTSVEDDLVRAQNRELNAIISYQNAVTSLDRTLGTTLTRRGIDVEVVESGTMPPVLGGAPEGAVRREIRLRMPDPAIRSPLAVAPDLDEGMSRIEPPRRAVETVGRALAATRATAGAAPATGAPVTPRRGLMLSLDEFQPGKNDRRASAATATGRRTDTPARVPVHDAVHGALSADSAGRSDSRVLGNATGGPSARSNGARRPAPAPLPPGVVMLTL